MRFRLFRSRAFWFGVPGLVSLLWGGWVSFGSLSEAGFGNSSWWIGQAAGDVLVSWNSERLPVFWSFDVRHVKLTVAEAVGWKAWQGELRNLYPGFRYIFIPYYAVVLAHLAAWAGSYSGGAGGIARCFRSLERKDEISR